MLDQHTVDSLLIGKGLVLLCPVPLNDQAVTKGQSSAIVGSSAAVVSISSVMRCVAATV